MNPSGPIQSMAEPMSRYNMSLRWSREAQEKRDEQRKDQLTKETQEVYEKHSNDNSKDLSQASVQFDKDTHEAFNKLNKKIVNNAVCSIL